ncbi:MAG: proton-conducting transporter membrane subunit, partial [Aeromonas sobria]
MTLLWILLIPFIGGLLCWQMERLGGQFVRWVALISMSASLLLSCAIWLGSDFSLATTGLDSAGVTGAASTWAAEWRLPWIPRFGISLHLAVDGLSLLMVMLTCFIGVLAILCSWKEIVQRIGFFHLNLLWILGGVLGVFMALDLFLFFFFWEMMLVPMYFLIALWGHSVTDGKSRINAATKFFIYTQVSGLIMLVAIIGLVLTHQH